MSNKQVWNYHGDSPKAGRKLLLLEISELTISLPLIFRLIHPAEIDIRKDWFATRVIAADEKQNTQYISLVDCLQVVTINRKNGQAVEQSLIELNDKLNKYFSDFGWRMVRKELSQIKKRQKKSHIELSKDLIGKLKDYMRRNSLDSFDQAIDNLLSEAEMQKDFGQE